MTLAQPFRTGHERGPKNPSKVTQFAQPLSSEPFEIVSELHIRPVVPPNSAGLRRAFGRQRLHPQAGPNRSPGVYALVKAVLFLLPAEVAHHVAFAALRLVFALPLIGNWLRRVLGTSDPRLRVQALGQTFANPIGLAAGFDKDAKGYDALAGLGFGFVEVGTVTAEAQPGNPKPRLFRLPKDRALINRMGFNNLGAASMSPRLFGPRHCVVGVNIGKTKRVSEEDALHDYEQSARLLAPRADYLVVNVSSPNTPGLRNLQAVEKLRPLLIAVRQAADSARAEPRVPLLVKIAPDLSDADVDLVAELAVELELDGIVATNTTIGREGLTTDPARVTALGAGGLSGPQLEARSLAVLKRLRKRVGPKMTLISVGGIANADQVWERLECGANLVQLYTAFIYEGPLVVHRMTQELLARLNRGPVRSLSQLLTLPS
jgi:dihydroorotate dehydrogenase